MMLPRQTRTGIQPPAYTTLIRRLLEYAEDLGVVAYAEIAK